MSASFSIEGLQSPAEVEVAWEAVEAYRQSRNSPQSQNSQSTPLQIDKSTAELAQRMCKALTWRPLAPRYGAILEALLNAPQTGAMTIHDLASAVGAPLGEVRANLSKLSGRMKRAATPEEVASLRTPFLLLAEIEYDEKNSSRYRLTAAGRETVRRYLSR